MEAKSNCKIFCINYGNRQSILANRGLSPIPVDEETISTIVLAGIGLYTAWKDNPTSKEGQWANKKLKNTKLRKSIVKQQDKHQLKNISNHQI